MANVKTGWIVCSVDVGFPVGSGLTTTCDLALAHSHLDWPAPVWLLARPKGRRGDGAAPCWSAPKR
jgi:hypothetical protein